MPFAAATATAAAPPSTSPKATADVQTTLHSLRQVPGTRDALPAGRPGLGRSYRRRSRPGQELAPHGLRRSEEHTSELQSLMRISYAVFCLKKKTTDTII